MPSLLPKRPSSTKWHVHLEPRETMSREMRLTARNKKKTGCGAWQSAMNVRGRGPRIVRGWKSSVRNGRPSKEKGRGDEGEKRIGSEWSNGRESGRGHENETGVGTEAETTETTGEETACHRRRHLHRVVVLDRLLVLPLRGDRLFLHRLAAPANDPSHLPDAIVRALPPCTLLAIDPIRRLPVEDVITPATTTAMTGRTCEVVTFRAPLDGPASTAVLARHLLPHPCRSAQIVVDREVAVTKLRAIYQLLKGCAPFAC